MGFFTLTVDHLRDRARREGFPAERPLADHGRVPRARPVLLFNYVGFELQNGAAEEMVNPQRDVPISVGRSAVIGVLLYVIPVLGILLVLPAEQ